MASMPDCWELLSVVIVGGKLCFLLVDVTSIPMSVGIERQNKNSQIGVP